MRKKNIIGYKLVKPEYEESAIEIVKINCNDDSYTTWKDNATKFGWSFTSDSIHADKLKRAGVIDIWFEPVYEQKKISYNKTIFRV